MPSFSFYVIILTLFVTSKALITNSKLCPKIPSQLIQSNATCDSKLYYWNLEALAHIPGGGHSINPFHNPYGPDQSCSDFHFICRDDLPEVFGDLHLVPKTDFDLVCDGISFMKIGSNWQTQIDHNPFRTECNVVEQWTNLELLVFMQNEYIFMYSCRNHEKGLSTELGAWILVNANSSVERKQTVLKTGLEMFDQIPGMRRDWWVYPESSVDCWRNLNCSYFSDCVTENVL